MFELSILFFVSALTCFFISIPVIWFLKILKVGQFIRREGPSSHIGKAGTGTMGGIGVIITIIILTLILINVDMDIKFLGLLFTFAGFATLGAVDDLIKIKRRENEGLRPRHKFLIQVLLALAFGILLVFTAHNEEVGGVLKFLGFSSPWLYLPLTVFMIVGASNAANLTDGLDGMLSLVSALAFLSYGIISYKLELMDPAIISIIAAGSLFAFLRFNFYPAQVFIGDVGSLSLGALLACIAILIHKELLLAFIGGIFVVEAASVILQVASYKAFKRRILKMAPIHHHFELMGIPEPIVVLSFSAVGLILGVLGIILA